MTKDNQKGILRLPQVSELVKLSRATIYRMIKRNEFPSPIQIGLRSVGWLPKEIDIWLESRPHTPPPGPATETKGEKSGDKKEKNQESPIASNVESAGKQCQTGTRTSMQKHLEQTTVIGEK